MKTRIIQTRFWDDDVVCRVHKDTKLLWIFLLSNKELGMTNYVRLPDALLTYFTGLTANEVQKAKKELEENKKVYFYQDWVFIPKLESQNNYKNSPRNESTYEKELSYVPTDIKAYFSSIDTTIDTSIDSTIDSTHKYKIQNNKYKIQNTKSKTEEVEILNSEKFTLEDFIKDFNEIRSFYMPNSRGLKVVDSKTQKQFKDLLKQGVTQEDMQQALRAMFADKHHQETSWRYCTPEFITRSDKFARFSITEEYQAQDRKMGQVGII